MFGHFNTLIKTLTTAFLLIRINQKVKRQCERGPMYTGESLGSASPEAQLDNLKQKLNMSQQGFKPKDKKR